MTVKIEELENGLKITETIGSNVVFRYITSYGFPFIRSTNEAGETYQVVDTVGEIYNLPALPTEFILESITNQIYLSSTGDELIENSLHLKPFRSENLDDRVISIGNITAGSSFVNVALDISGINSVLINGSLREKYLPDYFNFTPVTTGIKVLIVYAKDDSQIFYLAQGIEAPEAVEPAYVGLFVARLIISTTGVIIQEEDFSYKAKSDDTIAPIILNNDTATWIFGDRTNYDITATGLVTAPILAGFKYADSSTAIWNGKKSIIRNRTGFPLLLKKLTPPADALVYFPFKQDYTIADGKDAQVIYDNNNEVALIEIGGGSDPSKLDKPTSLPDGTYGLVKTGAVFSWVNASTFGQNISNTNLFWTADRTQNLGAKKLSFTNGRFSVPTLEMEVTTANSVPNKIWNDGVDFTYTNNAGISNKVITDRIVNVDKTGQTAYSKVMVINPTTKETVVRDFADPQATTLAVQNANTTQKTAMRTALLGAAVPPSPVINNVNTFFIKRTELKTLYLTGINLTPLEPISIWIEYGGIKVFANNFYAISATVLQTSWIIPIEVPLGEYFVKISNGATTQGASSGKMSVIHEGSNTYTNLSSSSFSLKVRDGYGILPNSSVILGDNNITISKQSTSYPTQQDNSLEVVFKTQNIFSGSINSSWEISIYITPISVGTGEVSVILPFIVLTDITDTAFTSVNAMVYDRILFKSSGYLVYTDTASKSNFGTTESICVIRKSGNKIISFFKDPITNDTSGIFEQTIDTSKVYAISVLEWRNMASNIPIRRKLTFTVEIKN